MEFSCVLFRSVQIKFKLTGNSESYLVYKILDGGINLSASQRRLLRIARALLTRIKFILMDEPFHDLYELTRNNLAAVLEKLKGKRTVVVISSENISPGFYDNAIELVPSKKLRAQGMN